MSVSILVTGSRYWEDREAVQSALEEAKLPADSTVIQGGASGADLFAKEAALHFLNVKCVTVEADWATHGKAAGPMRNRAMIAMKPTVVFAFADDLAKSRGTRNCITEALKASIPVRLFSHDAKGIISYRDLLSMEDL